jgi:hypothetical protein
MSITWIDGTKHLNLANSIWIVTLASGTIIKSSGESGTVLCHIRVKAFPVTTSTSVRYTLSITTIHHITRINKTTDFLFTLAIIVLAVPLGTPSSLEVWYNIVNNSPLLYATT